MLPLDHPRIDERAPHCVQARARRRRPPKLDALLIELLPRMRHPPLPSSATGGSSLFEPIVHPLRISLVADGGAPMRTKAVVLAIAAGATWSLPASAQDAASFRGLELGYLNAEVGGAYVNIGESVHEPGGARGGGGRGRRGAAVRLFHRRSPRPNRAAVRLHALRGEPRARDPRARRGHGIRTSTSTAATRARR